MKLQRFDNKLPEKKKSMKKLVAVLCICLIAVTSLTSYAIFKVQHDKLLVKSKVGNFKMAITIMIDGEESNTYPEKDDDKVFEKIECTKGNAEWDEEAWELTNINVSGRTECTVSFKTEENTQLADTSGAEPPVLNNGLIPVVYQESETEGEKGKWVKADTSKAWYNYDQQIWANAVTVSAETRNTYTNADVNTPISMDDIETMWVWIPRFEYQYSNLKTVAANQVLAQPEGIIINFISKGTTGVSRYGFTIHDAFKWDNSQLSGIWVAKFEMSAANPTSNTLQSPIIKPNVTSWRNAKLATFWTAIHDNMNGADNRYGLTNSDAHLMKNMEWGAVAYLSQSKYGKYGNSAYEIADKEVTINNCYTFKTGIGGDTAYAASSSTTCTKNTYETEKGQAASTTGNIYGIYDMSGGAAEYVMGIQVTQEDSLEPMVGYDSSNCSGWNGMLYNGFEYTGTYGYLKDIGSKYYDLYTYSSSNAAVETRGHQGDATYETARWYSDSTFLMALSSGFITRGGDYSNKATAGMFNSTPNNGNASGTRSGRPALVPLN